MAERFTKPEREVAAKMLQPMVVVDYTVPELIRLDDNDDDTAMFVRMAIDLECERKMLADALKLCCVALVGPWPHNTAKNQEHIAEQARLALSRTQERAS